MKHLHKQLLASAVAATIACSMLPVSALAEEDIAEVTDTAVSESIAELPETPEVSAAETAEPTEEPETTEQAEETPLPDEAVPEETTDEENAAAEQVEENVTEPLYNPSETESEPAGEKTEEIKPEESLTKPEMPEKPNTEGMSAEEANAAINAYNAAVEEYNKAVDAYNAAVEEKYASEQQAVSDHNAAEDEKVQLSDEAIAAYEELKKKEERNEELIVEFDKKGIQATSTTDADDLPSAWDNYVVPAEDAKTIVVQKSQNPTGNQYYVINIHLYIDEDWDGMYYGTSMDGSSFQIDENQKKHMVKAEWEAVLVDENDIVTVHGQNSNMGYSSMRFYRYMPGYINGTWIGSAEFASTCKNVTWSPQGQTFSYDQGTTDRQPIKNVFNMYTYSFYRKGAELVVGEKPDAYVPEYMADAEKGETLSHLDAMDLIEEPAEPTEPEQPVEPTEPVEPEQPTEPEQPIEPTEPVEPEQPTEPEIPVEPTEPEEPEIPEEPVEPEMPEAEAEEQQSDSGLPQTGQDWALAGALALAGVSALALGGMRKNRKAQDEI